METCNWKINVIHKFYIMQIIMLFLTFERYLDSSRYHRIYSLYILSRHCVHAYCYTSVVFMETNYFLWWRYMAVIRLVSTGKFRSITRYNMFSWLFEVSLHNYSLYKFNLFCNTKNLDWWAAHKISQNCVCGPWIANSRQMQKYYHILKNHVEIILTKSGKRYNLFSHQLFSLF